MLESLFNRFSGLQAGNFEQVISGWDIILVSHYLPITTFSNFFDEGKEIKKILHSIVLLT